MDTQQQILDTLIRIEQLQVIAIKPTLCLREAAAYLGITEQSLYKVKANIPHYKAGKHLYFDKADLDRYMHSTRVSTDYDIQQMAIDHCAKHFINF